MSLEKQLFQLKKLSDLQPDKRWVNNTKYELLDEISSQNRLMESQAMSSYDRVNLVSMKVLNRLAPSLTKVIAVFLVLMMGSGVGLAAQASVPGEPLWPIKRSIEDMESSLTWSAVGKTEVHIKHVNKRLDEINKILQDTDSTDTNKEKAIKQAVSHLEKDVNLVDSSLKIAKEEKNPIQVVELAKKVADATKEVSQALDQKSIESNDKTIEDALDNIKAVNKEVNKSAVGVALEVHDEVVGAVKSAEDNLAGNNSDIATSAPDMANDTTTTALLNPPTVAIDKDQIEAVKNVVKEMVASQISDTSSNVVDTAKQKAETVDKKDIDSLKKESKSTSLEDITTLKENPQKVADALAEAKTLLQEGFLRDAFTKINEVRDKYQRASDILTNINKAIQNHRTIDKSVIEEVDKLDEQSSIELKPVTPIKIKASMMETVDIKEVDQAPATIETEEGLGAEIK